MDIKELLSRHSNIKTIIFEENKDKELFNKYRLKI